MSEELISLDDAIETAYDIFLELAEGNLETVDLMLFTAQFDDRGAAELVEVADDWEQQAGQPIDKTRFAEVRIGLVNEQDDVLDDVFARVLISRVAEDKTCHIMWKRD